MSLFVSSDDKQEKKAISNMIAVDPENIKSIPDSQETLEEDEEYEEEDNAQVEEKKTKLSFVDSFLKKSSSTPKISLKIKKKKIKRNGIGFIGSPETIQWFSEQFEFVFRTEKTQSQIEEFFENAYEITDTLNKSQETKFSFGYGESQQEYSFVLKFDSFFNEKEMQRELFWWWMKKFLMNFHFKIGQVCFKNSHWKNQ
jgi:hypothetical protein